MVNNWYILSSIFLQYLNKNYLPPCFAFPVPLPMVPDLMYLVRWSWRLWSLDWLWLENGRYKIKGDFTYRLSIKNSSYIKMEISIPFALTAVVGPRLLQKKKHGCPCKEQLCNLSIDTKERLYKVCAMLSFVWNEENRKGTSTRIEIFINHIDKIIGLQQNRKDIWFLTK